MFLPNGLSEDFHLLNNYCYFYILHELSTMVNPIFNSISDLYQTTNINMEVGCVERFSSDAIVLRLVLLVSSENTKNNGAIFFKLKVSFNFD